ncbi:MAG: ATP-binding cassette domain-containing protein [Planctomycetota bacterium]
MKRIIQRKTVIAENKKYAVETFGLTKTFCDWWGRHKVIAVDDLSLKIKYNEVFGLLGPNGSGKTTTIKVLLSLLHPTRGKAIVLGGDSSSPKINSRIGFLPEESYLYRYLSAVETLDFYGRLFGLRAKVRKMRIEALLQMVGLEAMANRPVGTFSKGMARRIGLAQALINDPDLLILDEPTTGLDPIGTRQIKDLIRQLAKRGKTILLCSHLLADVEDICDRIAILYGGRLQSQGYVKELLQRTEKCQITTGNLSSEAMQKISQIIRAEQEQYQLAAPMEKLEAFFVRIVEEAQKQARPTSGAVSKTAISNFLAVPPASEILDKLVSAPASRPVVEPEPASAEPAEPRKPQPDRELLQELTQAPGPVRTEPVTSSEPAEIETESAQDAKDILSRLTDQNIDTVRQADKDRPGKNSEAENA